MPKKTAKMPNQVRKYVYSVHILQDVEACHNYAKVKLDPLEFENLFQNLDKKKLCGLETSFQL
jgi:hypothetical protein